LLRVIITPQQRKICVFFIKALRHDNVKRNARTFKLSVVEEFISRLRNQPLFISIHNLSSVDESYGGKV
jgi:hypothetical protein